MKRKKIVCGIISLALVSTIAPYSKMSSSLPTEAVGGDVNGDGKITVLNLMFLKRILLQS